MTTPYDLFETDKDMEQTGIWVDYGSFRFKVARAGGANEKYSRLLRNRMKPHRRKVQTGTMDEETAAIILRETFVDAVLLEWTGVVDREKNPLEFTRENANKLFTDLPELFNDLYRQCMEISNFRRLEVEEDLGN